VAMAEKVRFFWWVGVKRLYLHHHGPSGTYLISPYLAASSIVKCLFLARLEYSVMERTQAMSQSSSPWSLPVLVSLSVI
jgi:hypothetical protein